MLIRCDVGQVVTVDDLPDDVLLAIFDFYVFKDQDLELFWISVSSAGAIQKGR
jgi:hypothetical protein